MKASNILVGLALILALSGCRLYVVALDGGEVQSTASGTCVELTNCIHAVNDTSYTETFTAVPREGFQFLRWREGDRFLCAGSTSPSCVVTTAGLAGFEGAQSLIDNAGDFFISPIFTAETITDLVVVDGKEWVQPDLFVPVSYEDVQAVCGGPSGYCNTALNGLDLTGWTWASDDEIKALFNYYIGSDALGPGEDIYTESDSSFAPTFFADGWRPTYQDSCRNFLEGWIRNAVNSIPRSALMQDSNLASGCTSLTDTAYVGRVTDPAPNEPYRGAFFFRSAP